jgi:SulP family sulfate permease
LSNELSRNFKTFKKNNIDLQAAKVEVLHRYHSLKELGNGQKTEDKSQNVLQTFSDSMRYLKTEWKIVIQEPFWGANLSAGITVAAVALPLNLALAIAAGLPASTGLVSGAVGGAIAAIFGGSRFQVTGPAAALNAMVFTLVAQFGVAGAAAAALLVGLVQIVLSLGSAGTLVKFVPEAVLLGFTTGVGIKLLDSQIPKVFGIDWTAYKMLSDITQPIWLHEVAWPAVVCGLFVVFFILACKAIPRFPGALFGIAITTQLAIFLNWPIHRVGKIPPLKLAFAIPEFTASNWFQLIQLALPLGLLAAAESVLSAQAIDRISGDKHHSNLELLGQGLGNFAAGLVGGTPVSGVVVRSSVNVQSGGKNRLASLFHAGILLGSALFLGGILSQIPIASLAGLLCIIGFRLIEFSEFAHLLKQQKMQALGFIAAAVGTVSNHIVVGLAIGLALAWLGTWEKPKKLDGTHPQKTTVPDEEPKLKQNLNLTYAVLDRGERWLQHLKQQASVPNTAYIHPNASVIGRVVLGRNVHIAAEASIRADEGTPFYIGDDTNVQDGVVIHALKQKWIKVHNQQWAVYIGSGVSLAHQALVHGPCYIGSNTFVGFKAVVHDSIVGKGCYIGIGALVVGVEIPDERYVPHGAVIDSTQKVQSLTKVSQIHQHFNEDVVEVNKGLAEAYLELTKAKST